MNHRARVLSMLGLWLRCIHLPLAEEQLPADTGTVGTPPTYPEPQTIASVRATLDPVDFVPTDTNSLVCVDGVVTTHRNLVAAPDLLFFIQDDTGGLGVRVMRGSTNQIPTTGSRVRAIGQLADHNGVLELRLPASDLETQLQVLDDSTTSISPTPLDLDLLNPIDPQKLEALEGTLVQIRDVSFETATVSFLANRNAWLTNAVGERVALYVSTHSNLPGQLVPRGEVKVVAVLAQDDTRLPKTAGYHLLPCCYSEIVPSRFPPVVRFTNVFYQISGGTARTNQDLELGLVPGTRWKTQILAESPSGLALEVETAKDGALENLPVTVDRLTDASFLLSFETEIGKSMQGQQAKLQVRAINADGTAERLWTLYVPTESEQSCVITEFLANPTTHPDSPLYNPLLRESPVGDKASSQDEYLELLNYSGHNLNLSGWSLADALQVRHRFAPEIVLGPWEGLVVYGGPTNEALPQLPCLALPASTGTLSLNNDTEVLRIRNARGQLLQQIEYRKSTLGQDSSLVRSNLPAGPFLPHTEVATVNTTAGTHTDGTPFGTPLNEEGPLPFPIQVTLEESGTLRIRWEASPGRSYSVWAASQVEGPYQRIADRLDGSEYPLPVSGESRFLRISTP